MSLVVSLRKGILYAGNEAYLSVREIYEVHIVSLLSHYVDKVPQRPDSDDHLGNYKKL